MEIKDKIAEMKGIPFLMILVKNLKKVSQLSLLKN